MDRGGATSGGAWRGDEPPYHHPVFVLTHRTRDPIPMEGGTTFHFVDAGIEAALDQAVAAADGGDVRLGVLLGGGERLFDNLEGALDRYQCVEFVVSPSVAHVRFARRS